MVILWQVPNTDYTRPTGYISSALLDTKKSEASNEYKFVCGTILSAAAMQVLLVYLSAPGMICTGKIADAIAAHTEECRVRVCREAPHFEDWDLHFGHQWIEILDDKGDVEFSAGFWPGAGFFGGRGKVHSPDPYTGKTENIKSLPVQKRRDCEKSCDQIRQCIRDNVKADSARPPDYNLITNNCRDWTEKILKACCITIVTESQINLIRKLELSIEIGGEYGSRSF